MKQFFFVIIPVLTFLSSCHTDPKISVSPSSADVPMKGDKISLTVSSDGEWRTHAPDDIINNISPSSGDPGNCDVSITVPKNTSGSDRSLEVIFYCVTSTASQVVTITQELSEDPISMKVTQVPVIVDFLEGTYTIKVESNYPWEATAPEGATVSPKNGTAGTSDIKITIPEYSDEDATEYREWDFQIKANSIKSELIKTFKIKQIAQNILYEKETYKLVKLLDGRVWMAENLRLIPTESGPCDTITENTCNVGVWYPTKISQKTQQFDKSIDGIFAKGYLYTLETALGVKKGTITKDNAANYEGARGICPEGWHMPTKNEMEELVKQYKTTELKGSWLKQKQIAGMIQNEKTTGTTGTGNSLTMNTCYFLGSSLFTKKISGKDHIRSYGLKFNYSEGTISVTGDDIDLSDGTDGASIRCIMDQKTTK